MLCVYGIPSITSSRGLNGLGAHKADEMRALGLTVRLCVVQAVAWEVQWMLRYRIRKEEYDEAAQVCLLMSPSLRCRPSKTHLP